MKKESIDLLNNEINVCNKCQLRTGCIQPVPGEGNIECDIFFVGEACGREEDEQGRPFVGKSGKLLNIWIEKELGIKRSDVYIANIGKCRPPNNRAPSPEEIECCLPFLKRQLEIIRPKIIVTLGRIAIQSLLGDNSIKITQERGMWKVFDGIPVMPTYHPAFLLRQMSDVNKNAVKSDLLKVKTRLENLK